MVTVSLAIITLGTLGLISGTDQSPGVTTGNQIKVIVVAPDGSRKESLEGIKSKELTGDYRCGDGLSYNLQLTLKEGGRFDCTWRGCLGEYGKSTGEWTIDQQGLKLASASAEGMLKEKPLGRLYVIRFREHFLLLPDSDRDWFEKNGPDRFFSLHKQAARDNLEKEQRRRFEEVLARLDSAKGAQPSISVDQALFWLPPNTETLLVAQGPFEVAPVEPGDPRQGESPPMERMLQLFACGPSANAERSTLLKSLKDLKIAFVMEGARGFRSPKGLGLMPYEGCHIMVFKDDLKTAQDDFVKALKAANAEEKQIVGQKTFVIKSKLENDQWTFYFTMPKPNIILAATDQAYLEDVLKRIAMKEKPADRALPDSLPEWKHVNRKAGFWGIRHYDKTNAKNDPSSPLTNEKRAANTPDPDAIGLVFEYDPHKKNVVSVKYLSSNERAGGIAAMAWSHEQEGLKPAIRQKTKGVVEITVDLSDEKSKQMFVLVFLAALGHAIYI
jgi:hypothetical protein